MDSTSPYILSQQAVRAGAKRKRGGGAQDTESTASGGSPHSESRLHNEDLAPDKSKNSPMKRACNECRQQKLRCDVVVQPFESCSRCRRMKLDCRIDANFHRVDKRNRSAQMERELVELRRRLAESDPSAKNEASLTNVTTANSINDVTHPESLNALHQGAADSLLELRNASETTAGTTPHEKPKSRKLGESIVDPEQVEELFKQYFSFYHPFLPILDAEKHPDYYFDLCELLYWTIITVAARRYSDDPTLLTGLQGPLSALIWQTIAAVPHNHHVVKAFCLICTWPLPTKSTSSDPTFILSGIMMQVALQTGLHRPAHINDFSRVSVELLDDDISDRLKTWVGCNIVCQGVSTGAGQPARSIYDWTLTSLTIAAKRGLPDDLLVRLRIERFANKTSKLLYSDSTDPIGISSDNQRRALTSVLSEEYRQVETSVRRLSSPINILYLRATELHLRLSAFFDSPTAPYYQQDLVQLYFVATQFLETALDFTKAEASPNLRFAGHYLMQMILAGGFVLKKLLNSFFTNHIDVESGRRLFHRTVWLIRSISITNNDLPGRLAEVLAQLWRSHGAGSREFPNDVDGSLQLKVRCRMSMSLVYDSIWRWREERQARTDEATAIVLDTTNPTDPNPTADADVNNAFAAQNLPDIGLMNNNSLVDGFGTDLNYEVFDPLTWMLDGNMALSPFDSNSMTFPSGEISGMPGDNTSLYG